MHGRKRTHRLAGTVAWMALLALVSAGCGEQDLYSPPDSPYTISGRFPMPSEIQDVAILDHYAYVAAGQSGLQVVDIADPSNPQSVLWIDTPKYADAIAVARTYDADGTPRNLAFLVEGTEGILPYDISFVPDSLVDLRQGTSAYAGNAVLVQPPLYVGDPYILFLADSWRAVTGFVSAPDNPGFLDQRVRAVPYGYAQDLALSEDGTHLYVADDEMGVTVLDATQVMDRLLAVVGNTDTPGNASGIAVEGSFVFVAADEAGLQVLRAGSDYLVELVASVALPGECLAIEVSEGVAFVAAGDAGLHVLDIRDPYHPILLGSVPTSDAVAVAVGQGNVVCVADVEEGLIVFQGPVLGPDDDPPAQVQDLRARLIDVTAFDIFWTAPGDDGDQGACLRYDLRWSQALITAENWEEAQRIVRCPVPAAAGITESARLAGLTPGGIYYLALRAEDDAGNVSPISNLPTAAMTTPSLSDPLVDPVFGSPTTPFHFSVTYADPEGDAPAVHDVIIDGVAHAMQVESGSDYTAGVRYGLSITLPYGIHDHQFSFDDGHGPLVASVMAEGPDVPADPFTYTMVPIPVGAGASFTMGSPDSEVGRGNDETPHSVTLTRDFSIAATEVSQALYFEVMNTRPSYFVGSSRPVESVTWYDALAFCNALSAHDGLEPVYAIENQRLENDRIVAATVSWDRDANGYRLPTEAEWEYACRAGATTALCNGDLTDPFVDPLLDQVGWYDDNADVGIGVPKTHSVAQKAPNALGLYDMHGNVWEWCWDTYADYPAGPLTDPAGPEGADPTQPRVRRGGSWYYYARDCRSASRGTFWPGSADNTVGFRIARNQ